MKFKLILLGAIILMAIHALDLKKVSEEPNQISSTLRNSMGYTCKSIMSTLISIFINPFGYEFFGFLVKQFVAFFLFGQSEGENISNAYVQMIMEGLKVKTFEPNFFGEVQLPIGERDHFDVLSVDEYTKRILSDKPEIIKNNDYINNLYKEIKTDKENGVNRETMLIYHFSDLHWDLKYKVGANNQCGKIVCGNTESGSAPSPDRAAGKWGDYNCDANPALFHQIIYTLNMTGNPDMIFWTGDNIAHEIDRDPNITTSATIQITHLVEVHSPESIVFPIHGNHEFNPMNVQDFRKKDKDPVINLVGNAWKDWLTPEVKKEYVTKSYYSYDAKTHPNSNAEFKRKIGKTRIIGFNSQNGYFYNFELMNLDNDPGEHLEWFEILLREMEKNGEVGIVFSHMSPGVADGNSVVALRIKALFDRFQHILRLNLFGHTHGEEFEVIRSVDDGKPIGVNHLAPSFTTFTGRNPSFRAITLDAKTKLPIKIATYSVDLSEANLNDDFAKFVLSHELTEEYNLEDLSPNSIFNLTSSMMTDESLAIKYLKNKTSRHQNAQNSDGCDEKCRRMLSCHTSNSAYADARKCFHFTDFDSKSVQSYLFDFVYGPWVVRK